MNTDIEDSLILMKCESYIFAYQDQTGIHIKSKEKDAKSFCFNFFNLILQLQYYRENEKQLNASKVIEILANMIKEDNYNPTEEKSFSYQVDNLLTFKSIINNLQGFRIEGVSKRIDSLVKKDKTIKDYLLFVNVNGAVVSLTGTADENFQLLYAYFKKGCDKFGLRPSRLLNLFSQTAKKIGPVVITIYKGDKEAEGQDYLLAERPMKNLNGTDKSPSGLSKKIMIERQFKKILRKHSASWYWCFLTNGYMGYLLLPKIGKNYEQVTHNLYEATRASSDLAEVSPGVFLQLLAEQFDRNKRQHYFKYLKPDTSEMNINGYIPSALARIRRTNSRAFRKFNEQKERLKWLAFVQNKDQVSAFSNVKDAKEISCLFCDSLLASLPWSSNMQAVILDWPRTYKQLSLKFNK